MSEDKKISKEGEKLEFDERMEKAKERWAKKKDEPKPEQSEVGVSLEEQNNLINSPLAIEDELAPMVLVQGGGQLFIGGLLEGEQEALCLMHGPLVYIEQTKQLPPDPDDPEQLPKAALQVLMLPPYRTMGNLGEFQVKQETLYFFRNSEAADVKLVEMYRQMHEDIKKQTQGSSIIHHA